MILEDGLQRRDFVNVADAAGAARLALEVPLAAGKVFNIGSGQDYTVCEIAEHMGQVLGAGHIEPEIIGKYRVGGAMKQKGGPLTNGSSTAGSI